MRKHSDFPMPVGSTTIWFLTMPLCSCSMILEMTRIWYGLSVEIENFSAAVRTMTSSIFSILTYTFFLLILLRLFEKFFSFSIPSVARCDILKLLVILKQKRVVSDACQAMGPGRELKSKDLSSFFFHFFCFPSRSRLMYLKVSFSPFSASIVTSFSKSSAVSGCISSSAALFLKY